MDIETIIKLSLKAGIEWHGVHAEPDGDKTLWKGDIETFAKLVAEHSARVELNKLANWMIQFAFATGHGDTMEELLDALGTEVVDTIDAAREDEREACAKVAETEADEWGSNSDGCYASRNISTAIRARGDS